MVKRPKLEHVGIVIHIIVVLAVWVLFLLPVIFYYRSREGGSIEYLSNLSNFQNLEGFCPLASNDSTVCQGRGVGNVNGTLDLSANASNVG